MGQPAQIFRAWLAGLGNSRQTHKSTTREGTGIGSNSHRSPLPIKPEANQQEAGHLYDDVQNYEYLVTFAGYFKSGLS
jgi:hypothetical protein